MQLELELEGSETIWTVVEVELLEGVAIPEKIFVAVSILFCNEFSIYPSATLVDFQPPSLLIAAKSPPASESIEAADRRKQCPVYKFG